MRIKKVEIIIFVCIVALFAVFFWDIFIILHGDRVIPQLQRYNEPVPFEKGGLAAGLLALSFLYLLSSLVVGKFRIVGRGFKTKMVRKK